MFNRSMATSAIHASGIMRTLAVTRLQSATSTLSPSPSLSRATCSVKGNRLARHAWNPLPALRNRARRPSSRGASSSRNLAKLPQMS